jgi:hypothetical protein
MSERTSEDALIQVEGLAKWIRDEWPRGALKSGGVGILTAQAADDLDSLLGEVRRLRALILQAAERFDIALSCGLAPFDFVSDHGIESGGRAREGCKLITDEASAIRGMAREPDRAT